MKTKTRLIAVLVAANFVGALAITGCVSSSEVSNVPGESFGRQMNDLDQAYKNGDLTKEQYNKVKKKLANQYD